MYSFTYNFISNTITLGSALATAATRPSTGAGTYYISYDYN